MDLERLEALLTLLRGHEVHEFDYDDEHVQLRVKLGQAPVAQVLTTPVVAAPAVVAPPAAAPAPVVAEGTIVKSPMVGTFYVAPTPGASAFVEVGQRIAVGQTLCIVEAMKLMNAIESEVAGVLVERLVEDGQPVEYGQPMFRVRPA